MAATDLLSDSIPAGVSEQPAEAASDAPDRSILPAPWRLFDQAPDAPDAAQTTPPPSTPPDSEPGPLEAQLEEVRAELDRQRSIAAESEERCRALELSAARDRRAAEHEIEYTTSNLVRAHAMAVADRDRAVAQHEEAVSAREAAVRTRQRMETQRDEAIAERTAAEARRAEAIAQRDDARKQRDALHLAHRALQKQLKTDRPHATAKRSPPPQPDADEASPASPDAPVDEPLADAVIPAWQVAAAHLRTRGHADRDGSLTNADLWAIRFLGTIGALCFITFLLLIMKALIGL